MVFVEKFVCRVTGFVHYTYLVPYPSCREGTQPLVTFYCIVFPTSFPPPLINTGEEKLHSDTGLYFDHTKLSNVPNPKVLEKSGMVHKECV